MTFRERCERLISEERDRKQDVGKKEKERNRTD